MHRERLRCVPPIKREDTFVFSSLISFVKAICCIITTKRGPDIKLHTQPWSVQINSRGSPQFSIRTVIIYTIFGDAKDIIPSLYIERQTNDAAGW